MPADALTLEADDVRDAHHWFWRLKDPNGVTLQTTRSSSTRTPGNSRRVWTSPTTSTERRPRSARSRGEMDRRSGRRVARRRGAGADRAEDPRLGHAGHGPGRGSPQLGRSRRACNSCPLELAHVNGQPLALQDVSLVFEIQGEDPHVARQPVGDRLRMLAVFSLPVDATRLEPAARAPSAQDARPLDRPAARAGHRPAGAPVRRDSRGASGISSRSRAAGTSSTSPATAWRPVWCSKSPTGQRISSPRKT